MSTSTAVTPAVAATRPPVDVRVGTFNVQSVSLDKTEGEQRPWKERRSTVISQILGERLDVLGVQEVNPSRYFLPRLVDGQTQFHDLRNGLNKAGGSYRLTSTAPVDCVNRWTSANCVHQDRNASGSDRILYNTQTVTLVSADAKQYKAQAATHGVMNIAWAVFQVKATGAEFVFATTHLTPASASVRAAQLKELIYTLNAVKKDRPVISVGDFNAQKFAPDVTDILPPMKAAGYGDVLNQEYAVNPSRGVRAQHLINGWVNSFNHLSRDVNAISYETNHAKIGNMIDYIFASNHLAVKEFKVVLDFDPATMRVRGVFPSDHNMLRATITLP